MVSISDRLGRKCGGAILNENWIITATLCVYPYDYFDITISVGTHQNPDQGTKYQAEKVEVHEEFGDWHWVPDMALVKTTKPIVFSENVQPIALDSEEVGVEDVTILGWGRGKRLQYVDVKTMSHQECQQLMNYQMYYFNVCSSNNKGQEGPCGGDAGAPLIRNGKLVGIKDYVHICEATLPDVSTRVSSLIDWISETIEEE